MSESTNIEWCDSTWNPWIGCTKVGPGCDNCYAEKATPSRTLGVVWGPKADRHRTSAGNWKLPARWNSREFFQCGHCGARGEGRQYMDFGPNLGAGDHGYECASCGSRDMEPTRRRVFCASLADVFDNQVPIAWLTDVLRVWMQTPHLDKLVVTKRIGNVLPRLFEAWGSLEGPSDPLFGWLGAWLAGKAPADVWLGITVVNQEEADRDIPKLLAVPAAVRFLSIEPMLGPIDLTMYHDLLGRSPGGMWCPDCPDHGVGIDPDERRHCLGEVVDAAPYEGIDWVIVGGESGPQARPMHPDWARSLRDQCAAAGVPFLFKQWGEWSPGDVMAAVGAPCARVERSGVVHPWPPAFSPETGDWCMHRVGKKAAGRLLDGVEHNGFPLGYVS